MKIISVNHPDANSLAANVIQKGGIIVYPTDTLYGFGVDARNDAAIQKLNFIKKREGPISVIAPNVRTVKSWSSIHNKYWESIENKLGGKTTIILPVKKNFVSSTILGPNQTLGIRIPNHSFSTNLVSTLGYPITTTSVNLKGEFPLNEPKQIKQNFGKEIDLIIDDGKLASKGSTIYHFKNNSLTIIRQ